MNERPIDLREEGTRKETFHISITSAAVSMAVMIIAGIIIGVYLPDILDDNKSIENEEYSRIDVLLLSTFDRVETNEGSYENVPIPTSFEILLSEGFENEKMGSMNDQLLSYLQFIYNGSTSFTMKAIPGQGWGADTPDFERSWGELSGEVETESREVTVDWSGSQRTIFISIEIYREAQA